MAKDIYFGKCRIKDGKILGEIDCDKMQELLIQIKSGMITDGINKWIDKEGTTRTSLKFIAFPDKEPRGYDTHSIKHNTWKKDQAPAESKEDLPF